MYRIYSNNTDVYLVVWLSSEYMVLTYYSNNMDFVTTRIQVTVEYYSVTNLQIQPT